MESLQLIKYHVLIFKYFALWPPEHQSLWYTVYLSIFIPFILIGFPITLLLSTLFVSSVDQMVDSLIISITLAIATLKGINVLISQKKILQLFQLIRQLDSKLEVGEEHILRAVFKDSKLLFKLCMCAYMNAFIFLGSQSVFSEKGKGLWSSTYFFPFQFAQSEILYQIVFVHQAFSNLICVVLDGIVDTYGVILHNIVGGYVQIVGARLRKLGHLKGPLNDRSKKLEGKKNSLSELKKCIEIHQTCLMANDRLQSILSNAVLIQFGFGGLILSTCAYTLTTVLIVNFAKFMFAIAYSLAIMIEIFVPCYYATLVMEKSEKLTRDIYFSNWINQHQKFKTAMVLVMMRTLKPMKIYGGKIFLLHLTTFVSVLRVAYSMFALLKNI